MLRRSLLLLFFSLVLVHGCMPGYEAERDRLREHLGIEWVEHGLDKSAFSAKKFIRHSSDLDCDFKEPEACRWRNARREEGMDSLDFHLFEKTDYTEFPALRVRPGPSKVDQGDKMIFVGDKRRDEQTALFYSSQIGCQNSTGLLTFTFWIYNDARVEVVLLEDDEGGVARVLPDITFVDCGTVQVNTECSVEIAPRKTPFRLGIRAFNLANKDGSFVLVDNILYKAELCKVAIDLGEDFQATPLATRAQGLPVKRPSDLNCEDLDEACRWRNAGGEGGRSPAAGLVFNATGSFVTPEGAFAVLYVEQEQRPPFPLLRSDPIECQVPGENNFTLRFWQTRELQLEVCAQDSEGKDLECHSLPAAMSPSPVSISFLKATTHFMIAIRVAKLNGDFDNVVFLDSLQFSSRFCSEAVSVFDLGEHFQMTPSLAILMGKNLHSVKELACDFSRRATSCQWTDAEEEMHWQIGNGPLNEHKLNSLTQRSDSPQGEFAVVKFTKAGVALLISESLRCLFGGSLRLRAWRTGTAQLKICLLDPISREAVDCQALRDYGTVIVDIPDMRRPFRLALRADSEGEGLLLVDDIYVEGDVCASPARAHSSKVFKAPAASPDSNVCRLLSCNFHSRSCLYESGSLPSSTSFEVASIGMLARLRRKRRVAVLESPSFELNGVARLHFSYETLNASLFVCNDRGEEEFESCFRVEGTQGDDFMELLPSDSRFYAVARLQEEASQGFVRLSNFRLTDAEERPLC